MNSGSELWSYCDTAASQGFEAAPVAATFGTLNADLNT
jgi:hypothetical protein